MRRAVLSLVPSGVLATATAFLGPASAWSVVGVPVGNGNFGDLNVIFIAAQCASDDPSWTAASEPCQPGMSHYNYPSVWAKAFGIIGADPSWTPAIATLLMAAFIVSLVPITWWALGSSRQLPAVIGMTIVACSPPILLAFQRGNIDLLMFALIAVAVGLWIHSFTKSAAVTIAIATTLKVFPIGAVLMLLSRQRPRRGALLTFAVVGAAGLAVIFSDLAIISTRTPQIDGASFGTGVLPLLVSNQLGMGWSSTLTRLAGLIIFVVALAFLVLTIRSNWLGRIGNEWSSLIRDVSADVTATALILAGSGVFLVAYILGPSYDYRLMFLIPAVAGLLRIGSTFALVSAGVVAVQMFLSYSLFIGAAEYPSDVMLLFVAPALLVTCGRLLRTVPA